jgi:protein-S-isoprenylcysteine O-methyltransferase Ste14
MPTRSSGATSDVPRDKGPNVRFPPPLLFVAGLGAGWLLDRTAGTSLPWRERPLITVLGVGLVLLGLAAVYTGILTFRRFRTAVYPNRAAKLVVDTGIYAHTRNPMYLGMTVFYVGMVLLLHSAGALLLLPLVLVSLQWLVIRREERHLQQRFPEAYAEYCRRVRRWI